MGAALDRIVGGLRENWTDALLAIGAVLLLYAAALVVLGRLFEAARRRRGGRPDAERALALIDDLARWSRWAVAAAALLAVAFGIAAALRIGATPVIEAVVIWLQVKGLRIAIILVLAFVARRVLRFLVERFREIQRRRPDRPRDEEARLRTVSDVLAGSGSVLIGVVTAFLILETVLESIGTAIAGVGIVGVAVGFGAQSVVKDCIAGLFILLENQIAVGDSARINDVWGTVERIGLRTIVLRDAEGIAHIIPNGSILRISNATKGWSRAVVHVGAEYGADPDRVLGVLRAVAREARADPVLGPLLLEDLEVSGPEAFEDAVLYRLAARTVPARQFEAMRDLRLRVLRAFAREGLAVKKAPTHSAAGKTD